jgi:hypothetical protein
MANHQPLEHMALSFSGGGFRAAAFGLGCLSYLNRCDQLPEVSFMASASGGTLASLTYAYWLYKGKSFDEYYLHMKGFLNGEDALKAVFDTLQDDSAWKDTPEKGRNLINAFAKVYHKNLYDEGTWADFFDPSHIAHVSQICANSTEFKNGLPFRFQNVDGVKRTGFIGNYILSLREKKPFEIIKKIRLGDITAASSCFPLGFEPIMYPEDFTYAGTRALSANDLLSIVSSPDAYRKIADVITLQDKKGANIEGKRGTALETEITERLEKTEENIVEEDTSAGHSKKGKSFGLMDGGITDNQAIQSSILADGRKNGKFGTLIVCDVTSPFMDAYTLPKVEKTFLNQFSLRFWGLAYILITIGLFTGYYFLGSVAMLTVAIIMAVLLISVRVFIGSKLSGKNADSSSWVRMIDKYLPYFFKIPVASFSQMIRARVKSTGIMVADVFLKQIRRMWYDKLFEDKNWENRRISVLIYELSKDHYKVTEARIDEVKKLSALVDKLNLRPDKKIQDTAQIAANMGTTLWFDEQDVKDKALECLIATGQFTMCYNLIMYICELEISNPALINDKLRALREKLLADWKLFQENPQFMV